MGKDKEKKTDFIRCIAFGSTADVIDKYATKGRQLAIEGNLSTGSYKDKNHDDVTHYTTDVNVDRVELVGSKNDSGQTAPAQTQTAPAAEKPNDEFTEILSDGDVPF